MVNFNDQFLEWDKVKIFDKKDCDKLKEKISKAGIKGLDVEWSDLYGKKDAFCNIILNDVGNIGVESNNSYIRNITLRSAFIGGIEDDASEISSLNLVGSNIPALWSSGAKISDLWIRYGSNVKHVMVTDRSNIEEFEQDSESKVNFKPERGV